MTARLDSLTQSPTLYKKYVEFGLALKTIPIEESIRDLVMIRASQMNGCAFCVDMHIKQAKIHGERELRLHHLVIWRESPLFSPRERAALAWAEVLTRLPQHGVSDQVYEHVGAEFSEREVSDLTFVVVSINGWNRLSVAFRNVPGSADAAYGLARAGLA